MKPKINQNIVENFLIENREAYYRLAYSYVHNKDDALDIVQDAICKALGYSKSLNDPTAIKSWFYRIVVNTSLDFIRKNKRLVYVEDEDLEVLGPSKSDQYEDFDLQQALEKLPTMSKTIITLRFFEDMTFEEIAQILDQNINTVKTRFYTSIRKLRIELDDIAEFH
jgi:RNA polymerase sigma-70 factor (ECF subfamily)